MHCLIFPPSFAFVRIPPPPPPPSPSPPPPPPDPYFVIAESVLPTDGGNGGGSGGSGNSGGFSRRTRRENTSMLNLEHSETTRERHNGISNRCKNFTAAKRIGTPGNPTPVRMPHAHPETFRQFIHYIYTGKYLSLKIKTLVSNNIMLQDSGIFEMLGLAQELGVEELWRSCEEHVSATLSPGNACALLTAALDAQERVPVGTTGTPFFRRLAYRQENKHVLNESSYFFVKTKFKMSYKGPQKVQKVMVQPINLIFRYLQNRSRVQVWLFENIHLRIEGHIVGFDEYMNLVLDDAEEYHLKTKNRKPLGRIMLKGDNITLIQNTNPAAN
uniref:Probable small nuclear ribonucleoprotein E n=2 Tax=Vespinae TaxID=7439 RepID=A0A834KNE4_VESPE|nr:hypothetical protein H0235_013959 [Vespula pensylvanica]